MMSLKSSIYNLLPSKLTRAYSDFKVKCLMNKLQGNYPKVVERLRGKEQLKVAFFLIEPSVWKLDELFLLMMTDDQFDPIVVICPLNAFDNVQHNDAVMKSCEDFVVDKGFPYVNTKIGDGSWLDVKKEIAPDVIFFTTPYPYSTIHQYYITNYPDSLSCYVTYSSMNFWDFNWELNQPFHNYVWRYFAENHTIKSYMQQVGIFEGKNCEVTGFPIFDAYLRSDYVPKQCWKHDQKYKIIWAPHHTIDDCKVLQYSNFLAMADLMVDLAVKYGDEVQFAFKPHPMLRPKLEKIWGKERTDLYYNKWIEGSNTQFEAGGYVDLFYTSDAMIFDSSSFITEYLYVDKPSVFINKSSTDNLLNEFGQEAMDCHGEAKNIGDVENFIKQIVNQKPDNNTAKRKAFYTKYIAPYNTPTPSENIITHLKQTTTK